MIQYSWSFTYAGSTAAPALNTGHLNPQTATSNTQLNCTHSGSYWPHLCFLLDSHLSWPLGLTQLVHFSLLLPVGNPEFILTHPLPGFPHQTRKTQRARGFLSMDNQPPTFLTVTCLVFIEIYYLIIYTVNVKKRGTKEKKHILPSAFP